MGCLLTGVFAENAVVTMGGDSPINGGWINENVKFYLLSNQMFCFNKYLFLIKFIQVKYQLVSILAAIAWSFGITFIILQLITLFPFLHLRLTKEEEELGSDFIELGEVACK